MGGVVAAAEDQTEELGQLQVQARLVICENSLDGGKTAKMKEEEKEVKRVDKKAMPQAPRGYVSSAGAFQSERRAGDAAEAESRQR